MDAAKDRHLLPSEMEREGSHMFKVGEHES